MSSTTKLILAVSVCAFFAFTALQVVAAKTYYVAGLIVGLSAFAGALGAAWLWQKLF